MLEHDALAAAAGADDDDAFAPLDLQAHAIEHDQMSKSLFDVLELDKRIGHET